MGIRLAPTTSFTAFSGTSVAINANMELVGAPGANRAYLYGRGVSDWSTPQEVSASSSRNFCQSVDTAANMSLVGGIAPGAGTVFVFAPPQP